MPEVPSLQSLALNAIAGLIHCHEPTELPIGVLPFGGGAEIIKRLVATRRLRPETLQPLLQDWTLAPELRNALGESLSDCLSAAPNCRGLSQLAVQRLNFQRQRV